MSFTALLVPLAVAVITASVSGVAGIVEACEHAKDGKSEKIETKFSDEKLLMKTLLEHGVPVQVLSPDALIADFGTGKLLYERSSPTGPYTMQLFDVRDMDAVICNVKAIETEYGSNVQSYTYDRVKANLPEGMQVQSEQVLDDNSILLTLTVD